MPRLGRPSGSSWNVKTRRPHGMAGQDQWPEGPPALISADPEMLYSAVENSSPARRARVLAAAQQAALGHELEGACDRGELFALYQPQIDLATGRVVGVESLMRWRHPRRGLVSPVEFIPVAEASGQIVKLGNWILEEACAQAMRWRGSVLDDLVVSVNVSVIQLNQKDFAKNVERALQRTGLPANELVLEVTETAMLRRGEPGFTTLSDLHATGVRIAIDDFGTGYSCLSYLCDLPCHYLKIDKSFVQDVPGHNGAEAVARAIVALGRSLGLRVIAEGVAKAEQADFLQSIWCDEAQGFLYARPMTADDTRIWAETWEHRKKSAAPLPPAH
jgi:EAL domain-containing protein (putative c-di-GMP-specific phosphodiesterase class I)